jgi:exodeoxyribonuclease V alpha subunit
MMSHTPLFDCLDDCAGSGGVSLLGLSFARFLAGFGDMPAAALLGCVLLAEFEARGHSCLRLQDLADQPWEKLAWKEEQWQRLCEAAGPLPATPQDWRDLLSACQAVWRAGCDDAGQPLVLHSDRLYLRRHWREENQIARAVSARVAQGRAVDAAQVRHYLDRLFDPSPDGETVDWQKAACAIAARGSLSIITGGPGTGKTYTVARLLALLQGLAGESADLRIAMAAPSGKAAARLRESIDAALTGLTDKAAGLIDLAGLRSRLGQPVTLHALIGMHAETRAVRHDAFRPLDVDVLILDEASMAHLEMMACVLEALPPQAMLVILGDKDQLASVEAGAVLGDLCGDAHAGGYSEATVRYIEAASGQAVPRDMVVDGHALCQQIVMLRKSRRFEGPIGTLALAVNENRPLQALAILRNAGLGAGDGTLHWDERASTASLLELATRGRPHANDGYGRFFAELATKPRDAAAHADWARRVLQAFDGFRILCAVREGAWGVAGINEAVEQHARSLKLLGDSGEWYEGRPIIITRNDRGLGVANGDTGVCLKEPGPRGVMRVYLPDGAGVRSVLASRLAHVETAFAMTVHKVQGSEFAHAGLVLPVKPSPVVSRELIYTGITRARDNFTLVTPLASMLEQGMDRQTQRTSGLRELLEERLAFLAAVAQQTDRAAA